MERETLKVKIEPEKVIKVGEEIESTEKVEKVSTKNDEKNLLADLFKRLDEQDKLIKEQGELLKATADKGRLDFFEGKKVKKIKPTYKVSTIGGKIVVGWKMVKDEVFQDPTSNIMRVTQVYEFTLEDGKTESIVGYNNFANMQYASQIVGEEIARKEDENGVVLTLQFPDGRNVEIDSRFVN